MWRCARLNRSGMIAPLLLRMRRCLPAKYSNSVSRHACAALRSIFSRWLSSPCSDGRSNCSKCSGELVIRHLLGVPILEGEFIRQQTDYDFEVIKRPFRANLTDDGFGIRFEMGLDLFEEGV